MPRRFLCGSQALRTWLQWTTKTKKWEFIKNCVLHRRVKICHDRELLPNSTISPSFLGLVILWEVVPKFAYQEIMLHRRRTWVFRLFQSGCRLGNCHWFVLQLEGKVFPRQECFQNSVSLWPFCSSCNPHCFPLFYRLLPFDRILCGSPFSDVCSNLTPSLSR